MFYKLGKFSAKRPFVVFAFWLVALGFAATAAFSGFGQGTLFERLASSVPESPSSESAQARELMTKTDDSETVILRFDGDRNEIPYEMWQSLDSLETLFGDKVTIVNPLEPPQEYVDEIIANAEEGLERIVKEQVIAGITEATKARIADGASNEFIEATVTAAVEENFLQEMSLALPVAQETAREEAIVYAEENYLKDIEELRELTSSNSTAILFIAENGFSDNQLASFDAAVSVMNDYNADVSWSTSKLVQEQLSSQATKDLEKGEIITLPIALLVMLLIFGGFIAAGLPLLGAGAAIISGFATLWAFSFFMDIDTTVLSIITVIGLGVSIDYGLLYVSRYREFLRKELPSNKEELWDVLGKTTSSAGKTILFSAITIAIAVAGLFAFPIPFMWSVATAASSVVLLASFAVITLIPAILSLTELRKDRPSPLMKIPGFGALRRGLGDVAPENGIFSKIVDRMKKMPGIWLTVSILILGLFGSSVATIHVASSGTPYFAQETGAYGFFQGIQRDIPAFEVPEATIALERETDAEQWITVLSEKNYEYEYIEDSTVISVYEASPLELRDLRNAESLPGLITGAEAEDYDFNQALLEGLPLALLVILLATFVLLFLLTGSVIVPLLAIIFSILSLGASIGVLTWGFEGGGLAGILNFDGDSITGMSPIILVLAVVFGFGLAMDYSVFLIARMKEEKDRYLEAGESAREAAVKAVRSGLQSTGRVITSAGLIIVIVFLGFTVGDMLMIKQIGVALSVAVLVDMLLVRMIAMPAAMLLLKEGAWWAPRPLKKFQEKLGITH